MDKNELNTAIRAVILNTRKADAKQEHKIVEEAGYHIGKVDKHYYVKNEETGKVISFSYAYTRFYYVNLTTYSRTVKLCSLDCVGYLNKPFNRDYEAAKRPHLTKFQEMRMELEFYKMRVASQDKYIEETNKDFSEYVKRYQERIADLYRYRAGAIEALNNARARLGLTRKGA